MKTSKTNCSNNDATLDQNAKCSTMFSKFKLGSTDFTVMSVHSHTHTTELSHNTAATIQLIMAECKHQGRTVQKNVTPAVLKTAKCHWARPPHTRTKPSTWRRPRRKNKAFQKETNASETMDNKHNWTTLSVRAPTTHANRQVAVSNKPTTKNDAKLVRLDSVVAPYWSDPVPEIGIASMVLQSTAENLCST